MEHSVIVAPGPLGNVIPPRREELVKPLAEPLLAIRDRHAIILPLQQVGHTAVSIPLGAVDDLGESDLLALTICAEGYSHVQGIVAPVGDRAAPPSLPLCRTHMLLGGQ